jgi:hypothetical protein
MFHHNARRPALSTPERCELSEVSRLAPQES